LSVTGKKKKQSACEGKERRLVERGVMEQWGNGKVSKGCWCEHSLMRGFKKTKLSRRGGMRNALDGGSTRIEREDTSTHTK